MRATQFIHYINLKYEPISDCHKAQINMLHDRPMCTECKMYWILFTIIILVVIIAFINWGIKE